MFRTILAAALMVVLLFGVSFSQGTGTSATDPIKTSTPPGTIVPMLDGKIFDGKLVTKAGETTPALVAQNETVTFKAGSITSAIFEPKGFKTCPYNAKPDATGKVSFIAKAVNANDAGNTLDWSGYVVKDPVSTSSILVAKVQELKAGKLVAEHSIKALLRDYEPMPK